MGVSVITRGACLEPVEGPPALSEVAFPVFTMRAYSIRKAIALKITARL